MRKYLPAIIVVVILVIVGGVFAYSRMKSAADTAADQTATIKKPAEKYNEIPVTDRPYVRISPTTDVTCKKVGRSIELSLVSIKNPVDSVDFELDYQSGTLLQGAFGDFNITKLPSSQPIFLGSQSAGGKCTYNEDVSGGSVVIHLKNGADKIALKNDFNYIDNSVKKDTIFTSQDGKLTASSPALAKTTHATILVSPGYPANPDKQVFAAPYAVGVISPVKGDVTVTIKLDQDVPAATIQAWDGKAWKALKTTVKDQVATATGPLYEAYTATAQ